MDSFKAKLKYSLQVRLSVMLSIAIVVVGTVAGTLTYGFSLAEAHELQDDLLQQMAHMIEAQGGMTAVTANAGADYDHDGSRISIQPLPESLSGNTTAKSTWLPLPASLPEGLQNIKIGHHKYRVLVRTISSDQRFAVLQSIEFRNEIARDGAKTTLLPFLILMPILLLVVAYLVRTLFRPIAALSHDIDQRDEQSLHPIAEAELPAEIRPFTRAINRLLTRVAESMEQQRRFVADAAHELRSPLTALSLQAGRLADTELPTTALERLRPLRQGIERSRMLLDQLLALARAQSSAPSAQTQPVSVQQVYRRVLEDLLPLAESKSLDIGLEGNSDALLTISELDLNAILKNLVDNAIRYTPEGGKIDLAIEHDSRWIYLIVSDNGPGIAHDEQERVFDPFYRVLGSQQIGSGLGLSIVRSIVQRLGGNIRLSDTSDAAPTGLTVTVSLPLA